MGGEWVVGGKQIVSGFKRGEHGEPGAASHAGGELAWPRCILGEGPSGKHHGQVSRTWRHMVGAFLHGPAQHS